MLGNQLWHGPLNMASTVYERKISQDAIGPHILTSEEKFVEVLKARLHRRFLSQQLDAIFVAAKSHQVSNMFETPAILLR